MVVLLGSILLPTILSEHSPFIWQIDKPCKSFYCPIYMHLVLPLAAVNRKIALLEQTPTPPMHAHELGPTCLISLEIRHTYSSTINSYLICTSIYRLYCMRGYCPSLYNSHLLHIKAHFQRNSMCLQCIYYILYHRSCFSC